MKKSTLQPAITKKENLSNLKDDVKFVFIWFNMNYRTFKFLG